MIRFFLAILLALSTTATAERITCKDGQFVDGDILSKGIDSYIVRCDRALVFVPVTQIMRVGPSPAPTITPVARPVAAQVATRPATLPVAFPAAAPIPEKKAPRIPTWMTITSRLASLPWSTNLHQIPSTVVDKGQLRWVPYSSFNCGTDYEVNVYGDPDAPQAVEIGIRGTSLLKESAKTNCIEFMASVMGDKTDVAILRVMNRQIDLVKRNGLTIEITPATADDAYGGWWVSIYDEAALELVRATPTEIERITVPKSAVSSSADNDPLSWTPSDLSSARSSGGTSAGSNGGSVYVRGYTRSNGTYVAPHTRSSPGSGGGGRGRR